MRNSGCKGSGSEGRTLNVWMDFIASPLAILDWGLGISRLHVFAIVNERELPRFMIWASSNSDIKWFKRRKEVFGVRLPKEQADVGSQLGRGRAAGLKLSSRIARATNDLAQSSIHLTLFIFGSR